MERVTGWRRVWRDIRERRPVFDLVDDATSPVWYRGRPFPLDRLPVDVDARERVCRWAETGEQSTGHRLADELVDLLRAPVAVDGTIHRPTA